MVDYEALYNDLLECYNILIADDVERIKKVVQLEQDLAIAEEKLALLLPDETTEDTKT